MSKKKIVIPAVFFGLIVALAIVFRPLTPASVENTLKANGTISRVIETGSNDVVLTLKGDDRIYYLEEGAANGQSIASLQEELAGQPVEIYYVKRWITLGKLKHIARLDVNNTVVYSKISRR